MTEDELMKDWLENSNNGAGPIPETTVYREDVEVLIAATAARNAAQQVVDTHRSISGRLSGWKVFNHQSDPWATHTITRSPRQ